MGLFCCFISVAKIQPIFQIAKKFDKKISEILRHIAIAAYNLHTNPRLCTVILLFRAFFGLFYTLLYVVKFCPTRFSFYGRDH